MELEFLLIVYILFKGPIPEGNIICHKCNVPACCNPDHLYAGTDKDNSNDKILANTQPKGMNVHCCKLTDNDVREIKRKYIPYKYSTLMLGEEYGVSSTTINKIVHGKKWKHIV